MEIVAVNGRPPGSAVQLEVEGDALTIDLSADAPEVWLSLRSSQELRSPSLECRLVGASSVGFDAAELDAVLGETSALDLTVRSVRTAPLSPASGGEGQVVFEFVDRLELLR